MFQMFLALVKIPWFWLIVLLVILKIPYVKGVIGELAVALMLKFLKKDIYKVFHDLYIVKEDGTTSQIDHVVTSPYGIIVIETKNYKGWIFGNEKNKYWTQVIYRTKNNFLNPIIQNKGHIKHLSKFIEILESTKYISIISFSSRSTLKKVETSTKVVYSISLVKTIKSHKTIIIGSEELITINNKLASIGKADLKTKRDHVRYIKGQPVKKNILKNLITGERSVEENKEDDTSVTKACPRCGGKLIERNGKRGRFIGCSSYPKCRYTADLQVE